MTKPPPKPRVPRRNSAARRPKRSGASEREKAELRDQLRQQLNQILETRESARGLIVNLSDVLFDTGSAVLKSGAREKLARVAGILLSHRGLKLQVEGHTDSVGTPTTTSGCLRIAPTPCARIS